MKIHDAPSPEETLAMLKVVGKPLDREALRRYFLPRLRKMYIDYLEKLKE